MTRPTLFLAALLLAGCGTGGGGTVPYKLTTTDTRFVLAVRTNTQVFFGLDDADLALAGHDVCRVLRAGGVVTQAAAMLPGPTTVRAKVDRAYFAGLAAQDYCPTLPTAKPEPRG